jgi:hypothetical protein
MAQEEVLRPILRSGIAASAVAVIAFLSLPAGFAQTRVKDPTARPAASGGELRIAFERSRLMLGQDTSLRIKVTTPVEVTSLELSASVGEVTEVERTGGRSWTARYMPPALYYPQVALVSAIARTDRRVLVGWAALRMWGKGDAVVRTRPRAKVTIQIGKDTFGPARANRKGVAVVQVVVPPGVRHGWDGVKQVDLNLPGINRLHGWLDGDKVEGETGGRRTLYLVAVEPDGTAYRRSPPSIELDGGSVGRPRRLGAGAWSVELVVPRGEGAMMTATAALPGDAASRVSLAISRTPPPVAASQPVIKETPRRGLRPVYFWSSLGVSAALLTAGVVTRVVALDMADEYNNAGTSIERRAEIRPTGQGLTTFSSVALGVGAALAVGTGVLYWLTDFGEAPAVSGMVGPDGTATLLYSGTF